MTTEFDARQSEGLETAKGAETDDFPIGAGMTGMCRLPFYLDNLSSR